MHQETLPIEKLNLWAQLNGVEYNGVKINSVPNGRGSGVVTTTEKSVEDALLITVPQDLVLSLENVWVYAKSDKHLQQVLEAVGEYSRVAPPVCQPIRHRLCCI